ncbi:unnamed protein product, partial [Mesorhabditis spiculigera]
MLKLYVVLVLLSVAYSQSISCEFCKQGLASMGKTLMSNPAMRQAMARQISDNCDQVPDDNLKKDCRVIYGDHFDDILNGIGNEPKAQPEAMCQQMGYC